MTESHHTVDETLSAREERYGAFAEHAAITQDLKMVMWGVDKFHALDPDMIEALEMIQHKIARIINGDSTHLDSWHDIAGYARLVERRLIADQAPVDVGPDMAEILTARPGGIFKAQGEPVHVGDPRAPYPGTGLIDAGQIDPDKAAKRREELDKAADEAQRLSETEMCPGYPRKVQA